MGLYLIWPVLSEATARIMLLAFAIRFISSGTESKQIVLIHEASEKQKLKLQ